MHRVESPRTDDAGIELELATVPARRVTLAEVEKQIDTEHYFTAREGAIGTGGDPGNPFLVPLRLGLITFCVLMLTNGYSVVGKSACADPAGFDPDIGKRLARADAVQQIWPLLGYQLCTKIRLSELTTAFCGQGM